MREFLKVFTSLSLFMIVFNRATEAFIIESMIAHSERALVQTLVTNCTTAKTITFAEYESLKLISAPKLMSMVFTHYYGNEHKLLFFNNAASSILNSPNYNRSLPMFITIHGYFGSTFPSNYVEIAKAVKNSGTANVFTLDHTIMMSDSYFACATNARIVGEALGEMLSKLYTGGIRNFHLVGHSLGSHVSGFAGKVFLKNTGIKLNRISALDPAGPCFLYEPTELRLASTDADFVDVIHTNINVFGLNLPIGHVDFYPNGGANMPFCFVSACSHIIVGFYYAESVDNDNFVAVKCNDLNTLRSGGCANNEKAIMGYRTPTTTRGSFYLTLNPFPKYARGIEGTKN